MSDLVFVLILLLVLLVYLYWNIYLVPKEAEKILNSKKENQNLKKDIDEIKTKKKEEELAREEYKSFTGIKELENDKVNFLKELKEVQKKIDGGESVAVDATQALFLMRNFQRHELVTSETGQIKLKKRIMDFRPIEPNTVLQDVGIKFLSEEIFEDRGFIRRKMENGETICCNFYGQIIPDPDIQKEDEKNKKISKDTTEISSAQAQDISRKLTKLIDIKQEKIFEDKLCSFEPISEKAHLDEYEVSVKESTDILRASIDKKEKEDEAPSFDLSELDDLIIEDERNPIDDFLDVDTEPEIEKPIVVSKYFYRNIEELSKDLSDKNFFTDILRTFFKINDNYFFIENNTKIILEKSLIFSAIEMNVDNESKSALRRDFLLDGSDDIISAKKISDFLESLSMGGFSFFEKRNNSYIERTLIERNDSLYDFKVAILDIVRCKDTHPELVGVINSTIQGSPEIARIIESGSNVERLAKRVGSGPRYKKLL